MGGLQDNHGNEMLFFHWMSNATNLNMNNIALSYHRNMLFLSGICNASLEKLHLFTAANKWHTLIEYFHCDIAAMHTLKKLKLTHENPLLLVLSLSNYIVLNSTLRAPLRFCIYYATKLVTIYTPFRTIR